LVRLVRLSRVVRLMRLLRAVPELMVLIKGIGAASRSVVWTFAFLLIIIYTFAVVFKMVTDGRAVGDKYFGTIPDAMSFLLLTGLLPDSAEPAYEMGRSHIIDALLFMIFIGLAMITVMNMLVGVLVEVVSVVSAVEKESMNMAYVKCELERIFQELGCDITSDLTQQDIMQCLMHPEVTRVFSSVGVDVPCLVEVAALHFFSAGEAISFVDFLIQVFELREDKYARVKDIVSLRKFLAKELSAMESRLVRNEVSQILAAAGRITESASAIQKVVPRELDFRVYSATERSIGQESEV